MWQCSVFQWLEGRFRGDVCLGGISGNMGGCGGSLDWESQSDSGASSLPLLGRLAFVAMGLHNKTVARAQATLSGHWHCRVSGGGKPPLPHHSLPNSSSSTLSSSWGLWPFLQAMASSNFLSVPFLSSIRVEQHNPPPTGIRRLHTCTCPNPTMVFFISVLTACTSQVEGKERHGFPPAFPFLILSTGHCYDEK